MNCICRSCGYSRPDFGATLPRMTPIRTFFLTLACLLPLVASAQWQWIDKSGRRVFSDQPPPVDIPERNILKAPAARPQVLTVTPVLPASAASAPAAPASAASAPASLPRAVPDAAQEARRKASEAADLQRRKAEEERIARLRADNCSRARSAKATLDSGQRLVRTNEKGEREFLDDNARAAESRRLEGIIATDCKAP